MNEPRTAEIRTAPRFLVQAVYLESGRVLTVVRGDGSLDLPAVTPAQDENHDQALVRCVAEDTGSRIVVAGPWNTLYVSARLAEETDDDCPAPTGVWATVLLADLEEGLAAGRLNWVALEGWEEREDLTLALRAVLETVTM